MGWDGLGWAGSKAEKFAQKAFVLDGIVILPHYLTNGYFVSPGGRIWTIAELRQKGAIETLRMLWKRPYFTGD